MAELPLEYLKSINLVVGNPEFEKLFKEADVDQDGVINGSDAKKFFPRTKLPQQALKKIWSLSDSDKKARLSKQDFCVAMHLVLISLSGKELSSANIQGVPGLKPRLPTGRSAEGLSVAARAGGGHQTGSSSVQDLAQMLARKTEEADRLQVQAAEAAESNARLRESMAELKEQIARKEGEAEAHRLRLEALAHDRENNLESEIESAKERVERLEAELEPLRREVAEAQPQAIELVEEVVTLKMRVLEMEKERERCQKTAEETHGSMERNRAEIESQTRLRMGLEESVAEARERTPKLMEEARALEGEKERLEREVSQARDALESLTLDAKTTEQIVENLRRQKEDLLREATTLREQVSAQEMRRTLGTEDVAGLQQQADEHRAEISALSQRLSELKAVESDPAVEAALEANGRLNAQRSELKAEVTAAQQRVQELSERTSKIKRENEDLAAEIQALEREKSGMLLSAQEKETGLELHSMEHERLHQDLIATQAELDARGEDTSASGKKKRMSMSSLRDKAARRLHGDGATAGGEDMDDVEFLAPIRVDFVEEKRSKCPKCTIM